MELHSSQEEFYINPVLYHGRPQDEAGRSEKELRTYDLLDQLSIPYDRLDHEALPTIAACHQVDQIFQTPVCKNLFLTNAQKTKFYLLLIPGEKKFKTKDLSRQIGSARLSFAGPEYLAQYLNLTPGSVSILGLMNDRENQVQLLIDRQVVEGHPLIGCHPCINTSSLRLPTDLILNRFLPAIHHDYILVDLPDGEPS